MKKLLSLLLLFAAIQLKAQTDPVQVTAQLLPPYSLIVSEYYAGTTPKINLLLLNRDLARPTITVRLRMTIESQGVKLRTKDLPATTLATFTLTAGVPVYVSNTDLTQYFNAANLDFNGISANEYQQSGKLPEGFYTFCFEAIEVQSSIAVSRSSCAFAWMTLSDPPLLNIPSCGEEVAPINPQNIVFNWTPRHMAAPNAAFLMEYQFSITEINDALPSPESAFFSGTPLYTGTTAATTFLYGPGMPQLQANKRYAWRVRAVAKQGSVEQAMFKNNGYSQVCWFTYRSNCDPVTGISATVQGTRATIEWQANTKHLEYKVQYRMVADSLGEWFTTSNTIPRVAIYDLKASKQYEYRVGASCEFGFFNYSEKKYFTTGDSSNQSFVAACGIDGTPASVAAGTGLASMAVNDTIRAGDFTVKVTEVSGSNGNFSGKGYTSVPWLAGVKVGVEFTSITVNSDRKLTAGVIKTTYDPQWNGIFDVDGFLEGGGETGHVVTGLVTADYKPNVTITNPNQVVVTSGTNGSSTITINTPGGSATYTAPSLPATIQDNQGNIYTVNKPVPPSNEPTVTQSAQNGGQGVIGKMNPKQLDGSQGKVEFMPPADASKMTYAFDAWKDVYAKSTAFASKYERINGGSTPYYVAAKAIAPGKPDIIRAKITLTDASLKADSVQFISGKGVIFTKTATGTAGEYNVSLVGGPADDAQEIYACYKKSDGKTLNLGKLLVAGYGMKEYTVKLVPVNGATINSDSVKAGLNRIYNPLNVFFNVSSEANFQNSEWDLNGDGKIDITKSNIFTKYSDEMLALKLAFSKSASVDKTSIYLFLVASASGVSEIAGEMVRGKRFGFLFTDKLVNYSVNPVSHEIGHGQFQLKHTFESYGYSKHELPDNLMDYSNGTNLIKLQWDQIHDPGIAINLFENEESFQYVTVGKKLLEIFPKFKNSDNSFTFLAPSGEPISIPGEASSVRFSTKDALIFRSSGIPSGDNSPIGALEGFSLNSKTYSAYYAGNQFINYQVSSDDYYEDIKTPVSKPNAAIVGFPWYNKKLGFTIFRVPILPKSDDALYIKNAAGKYVAQGIALDNCFSIVDKLKPATNANTNESELEFLNTYVTLMSANWKIDADKYSVNDFTTNLSFNRAGQEYLELHGAMVSEGSLLAPILVSNAFILSALPTNDPAIICNATTRLGAFQQEIQSLSLLTNGGQFNEEKQRYLNQLYLGLRDDLKVFVSGTPGTSDDINAILDAHPLPIDPAYVHGELIPLLRNECIYSSLTLDNRVKLVKILSSYALARLEKWSEGDAEGLDILYKVIENAKFSNQSAPLIKNAIEDDLQTLKNLLKISVYPLDFVQDNIQNIFNLITQKIGSDNKTTSITPTKTFSFLKSGIGEFDSRVDYTANKVYLRVNGVESAYSMYEMIRVTFPKNNSFLAAAQSQIADQVSDFPAYYLYYLVRFQNAHAAFASDSRSVRILMDLVAMLSAIPTGGASLEADAVLFYWMSGVDIMITLNQNKLAETEIGRMVSANWDNFFQLVAIYKMGEYIYLESNGAIRIKFNQIKAVLLNKVDAWIILNTKLRELLSTTSRINISFQSSLVLNNALRECESYLLELNYTKSQLSSIGINRNNTSFINYNGADYELLAMEASADGWYSKMINVKVVGPSDVFIGKVKNGRFLTNEGVVVQADYKIFFNSAENRCFVSRTWKPIQKISNKYPTESMPTDGQLWGIAEVENGIIKPISNKGNTFNDIDFVVTTGGELRIGKKHHFLGNAQDVEAAGVIRTVNGKIKKISNASGHYFPTMSEANMFPEIFRQIGLQTKGASLEIIYLDEAGVTKTVTKFITQ